MENLTKEFFVEQLQGLREEVNGQLQGLQQNLEDLGLKVSNMGSRIEDIDERLERVEKFSSDTYDIVSGRLVTLEDKVGVRYAPAQMAEE